MHRLTTGTFLIFLIGLALLPGCSDPPGRLVITQPLGEHAAPVDIDADGIAELVMLTDQNPGRLVPIDSAGVILKGALDRNLDQVNIPGRPIALWAVDNARQDAVLAFTRHRNLLLAYLLEPDIDGSIGIDTTARVILARSPIESDAWDVGIGGVISTASGDLAVLLQAGFSNRPRGIVELDRRTLEVINESLVDAKLATMQLNRRTGSVLVGSHAAENGATGLDLTDSLAYLVEFDQNFRRSEIVATPGRFGAASIFPESDSTLLAFVRQDSPPDARLLRLSVGSGLDGDEIRVPIFDTAAQMVSGNFVGSPAYDIAYASRGSGVTVVDLETLGVWSFETHGRANVASVGDIDDDGREELVVITPERTSLIRGEKIIATANGRIYLSQHLYDDTFLGFFDGSWWLIRAVPDREALSERNSLLLMFVLGTLGLLAVNFALFWFLGPRGTRIPTIDFYQYLVLGDANTRTTVDHLVRIRKTLEDHARETGFSVEDLALKTGFGSTRELNRAIKAASGTTARTLIEQFRLNKAAEELAEGDRAVEEIAASVGFSSHQYFTTRFKKTFGVTPSDYRAK